ASRSGSRDARRCARRHACKASGHCRPPGPRREWWGIRRRAASRWWSWPVLRVGVVDDGRRRPYAPILPAPPPRRPRPGKRKGAPPGGAPGAVRDGRGPPGLPASVRGRGFRLAGRGLVAQFLAQDLADVALRQLVAELDVARLLVPGQGLAAVGLDVLG